MWALALVGLACGNSDLPLTPGGGADASDTFVSWADSARLDSAVAADTSQPHEAGALTDAASVDGGTGGGDTPLGVDNAIAPVDSAAQPSCGDGLCQAPESSSTCPGDCGPPSDPCGDGQCDGAETATSCAIDCKPEAKTIWQCLQGKCGTQVKTCLASPACRAGVNSSMNCFAGCKFQSPCSNLSTCVAVFAANPPGEALAKCGLTECYQGAGTSICGDGKCGADETPMSCPTDCVKKPVCGDGKCVPPENGSTCPADCAAPAKCGDEVCSSGESNNTCPIDCKSGAKAAWNCLQKNCSSQKSACQSDSGCLATLNEVAVCLCKCGGAQKCEESCVLNNLSNTKMVNLGSCGLNSCPNSGC